MIIHLIICMGKANPTNTMSTGRLDHCQPACYFGPLMGMARGEANASLGTLKLPGQISTMEGARASLAALEPVQSCLAKICMGG